MIDRILKSVRNFGGLIAKLFFGALFVAMIIGIFGYPIMMVVIGVFTEPESIASILLVLGTIYCLIRYELNPFNFDYGIRSFVIAWVIICAVIALVASLNTN